MKQIKLKLSCEDGFSDEIVGYEYTPGLAVHRAHDDPDYWKVTHIQSGLALAAGATARTKAAFVAHKLGDLLDWNRPLYQLKPDVCAVTGEAFTIIRDGGMRPIMAGG